MQQVEAAVCEYDAFSSPLCGADSLCDDITGQNLLPGCCERVLAVRVAQPRSSFALRDFEALQFCASELRAFMWAYGGLMNDVWASRLLLLLALGL
jgi:hypothetical protein